LPRLFADLLLVVSDVASTRFCGPALPALLTRDPVVTSSPSCLRLEAFSGCNSAYVRADLDPDFFSSASFGRGTTNVDVGAHLRAALRRVESDAELRLRVTNEHLEVATDLGVALERKVPLPKRWLRGFAEAQAAQAAMALVLELPGSAAADFLRRLPADGLRDAAVRQIGGSVRLGPRSAGGLPLGSLKCLRLLATPQPEAGRVYATQEGDATAWQLAWGSARLTLVSSTDPTRGFSGEGRSLAAWAASPSSSDVAKARWLLSTKGDASADELGTHATGAGILALLAEQGLVGFDLANGLYFDRQLPFDLGTSGRLPKRVASARAVATSGAVVIDLQRGPLVQARVTSGAAEYAVKLGESPPSCTCAWFARHGGSRGPCKHVLAVQTAAHPGDTE